MNMNIHGQWIGRGCSLRQSNLWDIRGFTLPEVIVVVVILSVLVSLTTVVSIDSYRSYNFQVAQTQLRTLLLRARSQAVNNIHQASHGVRIHQDPLQYVLFEGVDYAHRDIAQDVRVVPESAVTVSGLTEITFTQLTGKPNRAGDFTIQDNLHPAISIHINNEGQINLQ